MDFGLTDKVALVAASSRGLGRAIAQEIAREGSSVVLCARSGEVLEQARSDLQASSGGRVVAVAADLGKDGESERVVRFVVDRLGSLDILVTNAGGPAGGNAPRLRPCHLACSLRAAGCQRRGPRRCRGARDATRRMGADHRGDVDGSPSACRRAGFVQQPPAGRDRAIADDGRRARASRHHRELRASRLHPHGAPRRARPGC